MRVALRRKRRWPIVLIFVLPCVLFVVIAKRLEPAFLAQLSLYANEFVGASVNSAVYDCFSTGEFDSLSSLVRSDSGRISAVESDSAAINRLKSRISMQLRERLNSAEPQTVSVPLFSASGLYILNGLSPCIEFRIKPMGLVSMSMDESFSAAGINQTEHRIAVDVSVRVLYRGFLLDHSEVVACHVPLSNTLINGDVPQYYSTDMLPSVSVGGN